MHCVSNPDTHQKYKKLTLLLAVDKTTKDKSDNKNKYTDNSNSSEQEPWLSSDTLEANIEFLSNEEDLAATSTKSGTSVEHKEQVIFLIKKTMKKTQKTW